MSSQRELDVITLPGLTVEDTVRMTRDQALCDWRRFASLNGYSGEAFAAALSLFQQSADSPGTEITVDTSWDIHALTVADQAHDLMDATTGDPVAHELALRATGAEPGTRFLHSATENRCTLTSKCTNEPA